MKALLYLLCVVWITGLAAAHELPCAKPEAAGFSAERLAKMDRILAEEVKRGEMAGVVILLARHGRIAHFSAIGHADIEQKREMRTDTIFRLYSQTKAIASVALMLLYEEGRFQLTDPVSDYIPEFAHLRVLRTPESPIDDTVPCARPMTIQDLMRHTAGFSHGLAHNAVDAAYVKGDLFGADVSLQEMMAKLSRIPLLVQPGESFVYSVSPDVQARLVEILSGMPFDVFLEKRLFAPLGMRDTGYWVRPEGAARLATVYWAKEGRLTALDQVHGYPMGEGFLAEPGRVNSHMVAHERKGGSYGLVSTAEDYWRFAQMVLNGGELAGVRLLSPKTVRFMGLDHLGALKAQRDKVLPNAGGWGLGFARVNDPAGLGYISSEGTLFWGGAAGTYFWIDPKEDLVAVVMTQHMGVPAMRPFERQIRALVYGALL